MTVPTRLQLRLQEFEPRRLPATFTVSNLADSGVGSLRQCVLDANANPGADTVQFDAGFTGTLTLSTGEIAISQPLVINTASKYQVSVSSNYSSRLFVANADVSLTGLFMTSMSAVGATSPGLGGAILSTANLTLTDCGFQTNSATRGGSIYQSGGAITATRCTFLGDFATQGASIWSTGTVSLQYCEFDSCRTNNANSGGGGIWLNSGSLTIDSCSFRGCGSNNSSFGKGGAVYANGTFFAKNSTFPNSGAHDGGGLYLASGGTLWNCTVAYCLAQGGGSGGGINGTVTLESTIVSNNSAGTGLDIFGAATAKNCAIGKASGFTYTNQGGNLAFGLNLQMGADAYGHGGLVPTVSLLSTSPCKSMGSNPSGAMYDARGNGYSRVVGSAPDIGAYEIQPPPKAIVVVNDGSAQRSQVTQFVVTVPADISFQSIDIGEVTRVSDNAKVTVDIGGIGVPPVTTTTISLGLIFIGGPINVYSLADGVYQLRLPSWIYQDSAGQTLDGNGDGIGGDDYVSPTTPGNPNRIFRLFGDANGDATVDATDFIQFRLSFGGTNPIFDFDGDGFIAASDFIQFRLRFGGSI